MGLFYRDKPKIKSTPAARKETFSGWRKCTQCEELIHTKELKDNLQCCPKCSFHYPLGAIERIAQLSDEGTFYSLYEHLRSKDPLSFFDTRPYEARLKEALEKSESSEAITVGIAKIRSHVVALGVMDFSFMAGSMGSVVGERLTRLIEYAIVREVPVVTVSTSGGARMQESIFSLMQMAKTAAALRKLKEAKLAFLSVLADPTSGGVTASFAMLGDLIIAEPKALICFAGPRVIEQNMNRKLPEEAQRSEFLLDHGMIDMVVERRQLKETLGSLLTYTTYKKQQETNEA